MPVTQFDCVVIGTGTGMFAALAAADAGLSVLLVEKSEYVGGSTALSGGGIWVPGNRVLAEAGARESSATSNMSRPARPPAHGGAPCSTTGPRPSTCCVVAPR